MVCERFGRSGEQRAQLRSVGSAIDMQKSPRAFGATSGATE
ncbi:hypothetical protein HM1_1988 [Heliomicrobium modesticaldum Ice1]|uniref:Uncharacterized protein n=1 Tax=Heliobacterium modesticaldum (strain ATCC 51547 / Ice1) TaxID=498761 RepID=B0TFW6_HELMI|nr:hypothetical protein HM1_1988 [Heliomicrobium modesticaldum Ice1]